jgi:hypothetical protein
MAARSRQDLAEAIAALADIDRQIAQAANATQAAMDGRRTARRTLERLTAEADPGPDVESFSRAVAAGEAPTMLAPSRTKAEIEAPLRAELGRWEQMVIATEAKAKELAGQRDMVVIRRDKAVDAVVAGSGVAAGLLSGLQDLQQQLIGRRWLLSRLVQDHLVDDATLAEIRAVVRQLQRLPEPDLLDAALSSHPVAVRWKAALDALAADADAPMPTAGDLLGERP